MPVKLKYDHKGTGDALVLLHGLFGSGRNLDALARKFCSNRTVISPDLRNHGNSPHHDVMDYLTMADDIKELMVANSVKNPVLVGHSMGGKVAMVNALLYPEEVTAVVILDIAPAEYTFEHQPVLETLANLDLESIQSRRDADELLGEEYRNPMFRQFLLQNLVRINGHFQWRLNLDAISNNIHHITGFPELPGRSYDGPALFLGGDNSAYISNEHHADIHRLFPSARIKIIPDAGHWLHVDQTATVIAEIEFFLRNDVPG
ncbi:MAG: alpha/beta fold hydrolase [Gammaproteobacteria bacterium]|nr:alpha/beta fold hydrolase [Gammaproteobacteria bacterium]